MNYQEKILKEKKEIDLKFKNLQNFIKTNKTFQTLDEFEKGDLEEQLNIMRHYSLVLQSRINRF